MSSITGTQNVMSLGIVPRALRDVAEKVSDLPGNDGTRNLFSEHDARNALAQTLSALDRGRRPPEGLAYEPVVALRRHARHPGNGVRSDRLPQFRGTRFTAQLGPLPVTDAPIDVVLLDRKGNVLWHGSPGEDGALVGHAPVRAGQTVRAIVLVDGERRFDEHVAFGGTMALRPSWPPEGRLSLFGLDWRVGPAAPERADAYPDLVEAAHGDRALVAAAVAMVEDHAAQLPADVDLRSARAFFAEHGGRPITRQTHRELLRALLYPVVYDGDPANLRATLGAQGGGLLRPTRREIDPIQGGFDAPLEVVETFATFAHRVPAARIDELLRRYDRRITGAASRDPQRSRAAKEELVAAIRVAAADRGVFRALERFFADGGTLVAGAGGGRYDPAAEPWIMVGVDGDAQATEVTFVHELLHYVFDRLDAQVGAGRDGGGSDHPTLEAMTRRYEMARALTGQDPNRARTLLDEVTGGALGQQVAAAADAGDLEGLAALAADVEAVADAMMSSGYPGPTEWRMGRHDMFVYMPDQLRDLHTIWRARARMWSAGVLAAVEIARARGISVREAVATDAWAARGAEIVAGEGTASVAPPAGPPV